MTKLCWRVHRYECANRLTEQTDPEFLAELNEIIKDHFWPILCNGYEHLFYAGVFRIWPNGQEELLAYRGIYMNYGPEHKINFEHDTEDPEYRGRGLHSLLRQWIDAHLDEHGLPLYAQRAMVYHDYDNRHAIALSESASFVRQDRSRPISMHPPPTHTAADGSFRYILQRDWTRDGGKGIWVREARPFITGQAGTWIYYPRPSPGTWPLAPTHSPCKT